jgi:putative transposase
MSLILLVVNWFFRDDYFVSTVGRDETAIREYIRNQEVEDKRLDQLKMWK